MIKLMNLKVAAITMDQPLPVSLLDPDLPFRSDERCPTLTVV
jgi:hypothetical protein